MLMVWLVAAAQLLAEPFNFVQISDTHIGGGGSGYTRAAVASINKLPMKLYCVIHTGDIRADTLDKPEMLAYTKKLLADLKPPLLTVAGNHDIEHDNREQTHQIYTNNFGPLIQTMEHEGVRFISVYTEPLAKGTHIEGYEPLRELEP